MTTTTAGGVFRLFCAECEGVSFPLDGVVELARHTTRHHWRRPTLDERTPVDTVAHLRVDTPAAESWAEQVDRNLAAAGRLHVDDLGRRWCIIVTGFGMTRLADRWVAAHPAPEVHPTRSITDPVFVAALDRWDSTHPTPDPTPTAGPAVECAGVR